MSDGVEGLLAALMCHTGVDKPSEGDRPPQLTASGATTTGGGTTIGGPA
ncbi:hypothetical protein LWC05_08395 [Acetobacter sicerae]|uniref:Uncharacterized protein n=1 Tax=Acetobacter sicerae TaxID=85325 RepID=A0ABS8VZE0_9PROT|nr:hypothetical protein [Acetobacter sicerae]MCE0743901.1 hypothetical protein [Acetobacter sicerae]